MAPERILSMLIFDQSESIPSNLEIKLATELGSDQLTTAAGEGEWDDTERILRANPSWACRLDHPSSVRVKSLSTLFINGSRYEKYYWEGVSHILDLDEEIIRCFPTPIVACQSEYDIDLSTQAQSIIKRLASQAASSVPNGSMIYESLLPNFKPSFGDLLDVVGTLGS